MCAATASRTIWKRPNASFAGSSKLSKRAYPGAAVKDEMTTLEGRRRDLLGQLEAAPPPVPRLHPNIAEIYRQKIASLREALNDEHTRPEAAECIRELIEEIRLVPAEGKLSLQLFGELAGSAQPRKRTPPLWGNGGASNDGCGDSQPPIPNSISVDTTKVDPSDGIRTPSSNRLRHELSRNWISLIILSLRSSANSCAYSGTLRDFGIDTIRAETNSSDIGGVCDFATCISFSDFGGTAVSGSTAEFAVGERDAQRETVVG